MFCLLVIVGLRLVPSAVFEDAGQAARMGRNAAVLGMLYVTIASCIPCQAHPTQRLSTFQGCRQERRVGSSRPKQFANNKQSRQSPVQAYMTGRHFATHRACASPFDVCPESQKLVPSMLLPKQRLACSCNKRPMILITRGGQSQFYACEDAAPQRLLILPSRLAGGFFLAEMLDSLLFGDL
jgi:hypothetical protein